MIKKLFLASTAIALLTGAASAADLPRRAAPPVFVPVPVFTWTGAYFGINAGYGFDAGSSNRSVVLNDPTAPVILNGAATLGTTINYSDRDRGGFTGGGQVGYNYQFTPGSGIVVGIEADAQYLDFGGKRSRAATVDGFVDPAVTLINPSAIAGLDYFGTVRGRIGYAFDRVLFYGTGGFAYGSGGSDRNFGFSRNEDFRTGYTAGGGIEYALPTDSFFNFFRSSAVTLKVEGLYVNLERKNNNGLFAVDNFFTPPVAYYTNNRRSDDEFAVVRAGLNYKFGSY